MALTNNIERRMMLQGSYTVSIPAAGTDVFYKGAMVNIAAAGNIEVAADAASEFYGGIVFEYVSAVTGTLVKIIRSAKVWLPKGTTVLTDMMSDVFATADDTVALSASNVPRMGIVVDYDEDEDEILVDTAYAENA